MYTESNNPGIYIEKRIRIPGSLMSYEHTHKYYELFYLKNGTCVYSVSKNVHNISAGEIFSVTPGDPHSTRYEGDTPCERIVVYFDPEILGEEYWKQHSELAKGLSSSGKIILNAVGRVRFEKILDDMQSESNNPNEYSSEFLFLYLEMLLLEITKDGIFIYEDAKSYEGISRDIEEVLRFIGSNFASPLTLEDVAKKISLSDTYFSKKFKKETGTTFSEYLNNIRIRQAIQMLLTTDDSVTKISVNCGFNSSNYFKDCFKKIVGMSPRSFKKQSLNSEERQTLLSTHLPIDRKNNV